MSSILKALRKLEDEKAALGEGSVDLAHDILKRSFDDRKSFSWRFTAAGSLLLLFIAGGGWWLYQSLLTPQKTTPLPQVIAEETTSEPLAPQPTWPKDEQLPVVEQKLATAVLTKPDIKPATNQQPPVPAISKHVPALVVASQLIDIPQLRVDEIVYHQQPGSRLAVINELPVMEGTDIEGAHVEEILPDRVRFSFQGIRFNKFLSSIKSETNLKSN